MVFMLDTPVDCRHIGAGLGWLDIERCGVLLGTPASNTYRLVRLLAHLNLTCFFTMRADKEEARGFTDDAQHLAYSDALYAACAGDFQVSGLHFRTPFRVSVTIIYGFIVRVNG
jgi:hypothetical protein